MYLPCKKGSHVTKYGYMFASVIVICSSICKYVWMCVYIYVYIDTDRYSSYIRYKYDTGHF